MGLNKIKISPLFFFEKSQDAFLEFRNDKNLDELAHSIVTAFTTTEIIFKNKLMKINPVLCLRQPEISPESVEMMALSSKIRNIAALKPQSPYLKTADFQTLSERIFPFLPKNTPIGSIAKLHRTRNEILHAGYISGSISEIEHVLSDDIFPFLKKELRASITGKAKALKRAQKEIDEQFSSEIKGLIEESKKYYKGLSVRDVETSKQSRGVDKDEMVEEADLPCPACTNATFDIIIGVDFDWNPDGMLTNGYLVGKCRVCKLELSEHTLREISGDNKKYFTQGEGWDVRDIIEKLKY